MWKTISDVIGKTKNNTYIKEIVSSDGETLTDKKLIANEFNHYFNTIPTKTQSDLDPSLHSYENLVPTNVRSMFMKPSSPIEIVNVITQLSNKNSSTKLPLKFLKYIKYEIATILCKLFNLCIERGTYPESLKIAKVIPLYKNGNVGSVANYRLISLLPLLNKIFEKLLYVRLNNFLESCNIISQNQFS